MYVCYIPTLSTTPDPYKWPHWITEAGAIKSNRSTAPLYPVTPKAGERTRRTFANEEVEDDEADISYRTPPQSPPPKKPIQTRKRRKFEQEEVEEEEEEVEVATIIHSPIKSLTPKFKDTPLHVVPIHEPRSIQDVADGSFWTIVRVPIGLAPTLDERDEHSIILRLTNYPPNNEEIATFPEGLKISLKAHNNASFLDKAFSPKFEVRIDPPSRDVQWVHEITSHPRQPPAHHIVIHWTLKQGRVTNLF